MTPINVHFVPVSKCYLFVSYTRSMTIDEIYEIIIYATVKIIQPESDSNINMCELPCVNTVSEVTVACFLLVWPKDVLLPFSKKVKDKQ